MKRHARWHWSAPPVALGAALGALLFADGARASERAVVLLPLASEQVASDVVDGIAALIVEEVDDRGFKLLELTDRVRRMAEGCAAQDLDCLRGAADRRGADVALRGAVKLVEGELRLHLEAMNVEDGVVTGSADETLAGDQGALRHGVRRAVFKLLTPERFTGTLTVGCNIPQAAVVVDGQTRGTTPLVEPIGDLSEGAHSVRVEKPGYDPFVSTVDIVFSKNFHLEALLLRRADISAEELAAQAQAESTAGSMRPGLGVWPWVMVGAGAASVGGAVALGVLVLAESASVEARAERQVFTFPRDREAVERAQLYALLANSLYTVGGVLAAAGLGLGVWDLLVSDPAQEPAEETEEEDDDWDQLVEPTPPRPTAKTQGAEPEISLEPDPEPDLEPPAVEVDETEALPDGDELPEGDL